MSRSPTTTPHRARALPALATLLLAAALAVALAGDGRAAGRPPDPRLWATINVCDTSARPDTIGLRASMPGTGNAADELFMRFTVQYFSPADGAWRSLGYGGDSGFVSAGSGRQKVREAGRFFVLAPLATRTGHQLRGLVSFEWRRNGVVTQRQRRVTTPKHVSAAGADPPGYSAAICVID